MAAEFQIKRTSGQQRLVSYSRAKPEMVKLRVSTPVIDEFDGLLCGKLPSMMTKQSVIILSSILYFPFITIVAKYILLSYDSNVNTTF